MSKGTDMEKWVPKAILVNTEWIKQNKLWPEHAAT